MKIKEVIEIIFAGAATFVSYFLGGFDAPLIALITLMAIDYTTGIMKGYVTKTLSSDIGFRGLCRKCTVILVLIVAVLLDTLINPDNPVFRTLVCYFYIANEGISITENISSLGVPVPDKLKNALEQLKNEEVS